MNDNNVTEEKHTVAADSWETLQSIIFYRCYKNNALSKKQCLAFLLVYRMHTGHWEGIHISIVKLQIVWTKNKPYMHAPFNEINVQDLFIRNE